MKTISKAMKQTDRQEDIDRVRISSKNGPYTSDPCVSCGRCRVMRGDDGKHRCEKCGWCFEEGQYDADMQERIQ